MNCFMCKGKMKQDLINHVVDLKDCIIIIKNVPALVCGQCGEVFFENNVMKRIESIVETLKNNVTEIAVVNYNPKVA